MLIVFTITFNCIMIALVILYTCSERKQGLGTANSSQRYLRTYGPTAGRCLSISSNADTEVQIQTFPLSLHSGSKLSTEQSS